MTTAGILIGVAATLAPGQIDKGALKAKLDDHAGERWVYDDLAKGFELAKSSSKPMLVVLRCTR